MVSGSKTGMEHAPLLERPIGKGSLMHCQMRLMEKIGSEPTAGILLNKKPSHLYVDADEQKYWQRVRQSPKRTAREIRARFRDVDRRLADVETYYVSSNPRLTAEIERLR